MKKTRPHAMKVGKPAAKQVAQKGSAELCSDCPLACKHIGELLTAEGGDAPRQSHPIEIFARAYGM
jgi:glycerol-3-phosphate dehydrogenase subunit C